MNGRPSGVLCGEHDCRDSYGEREGLGEPSKAKKKKKERIPEAYTYLYTFLKIYVYVLIFIKKRCKKEAAKPPSLWHTVEKEPLVTILSLHQV